MSNESQVAVDESFSELLDYIEVNFPEDAEVVEQADRELLYRMFHSGFGFGQKFQQETILERLKEEGIDFEVVTTPLQ